MQNRSDAESLCVCESKMSINNMCLIDEIYDIYLGAVNTQLHHCFHAICDMYGRLDIQDNRISYRTPWGFIATGTRIISRFYIPQSGIRYCRHVALLIFYCLAYFFVTIVSA